MGKVFSWILGAALLASVLAACGSKAPVSEDGLEGSWSAGIDLAAAVNRGMVASGMSEVMQVQELDLALVLELRSDGTYTMGVDAKALDQSLKDLKEQLKERLTQHFAQVIPGVDAAGALAQSGMSMDALVDQAFDLGAVTGAVNMTGRYKADNGGLYLSVDPGAEPTDRYFVYTLADDTLRLEAGDAALDESLAGLLPLSFERAEEAAR